MVGAANTLIDLAVFALLLRLGTAPLAANAAGWLVAVLFSYVANSRWTFERDPAIGEVRSLLRFVSLGALVTLAVSSLAVGMLTPMTGPAAAKLTGLAAAAVLNFLAARWSIENRLR